MTTAVSSTMAQPVVGPRRKAEDSATTAALAFEALLQGTQTAARADTLSQTRASPSQMFEPATEDPGQARIAELQEEHSPRQDTSSASRAEQVSPTPKELSTTSRPPGPVSPPQAPRESAMSSATAAARQPEARATQPIAPHTSERPKDQAPLRVHAEPPKMITSAPMPRSASIAVSTPAPTLGAANPTLARQVGELLAASRPAGQPVTEGVTFAPNAATNRPSVHEAVRRPAEAKPPTEQTAQSPSGTADSVEETPFARLVRSIRIGERISSARLQLHPPELGRMRVDVRLTGDQLALDVRTETQAARDLVAQRAGELKLALEQHGIWVHRFDVTVQESPPPLPVREGEMRDGSKRAQREDENKTQSSPSRAFAFARLDVQG